jgi:hypothetical protein
MADPKRVALTHEERFPHGAFAVSVGPVAEYDGDRGRTGAQARDRDSGLPVWAVEVFDPDPEARAHQARVRIPAAEEPELPPEVGVAGTGYGLRPVWFTGLVGTPYMDTNGRRPRVAWSLRADSMTAPPPDKTTPTPAVAPSTGTGAAVDGSGTAGRRAGSGSGESR